MGDSAWSHPVDCWAAALVVSEVWNGGGGPVFQVDSVVGLVTQVFSKLGSPTGDDLKYFRSLPHFSDRYPTCPQPRSVLLTLGCLGRGAAPDDVDEVFRGLVALNAPRRTACEDACHRPRLGLRLQLPLRAQAKEFPVVPRKLPLKQAQQRLSWAIRPLAGNQMRLLWSPPATGERLSKGTAVRFPSEKVGLRLRW